MDEVGFSPDSAPPRGAWQCAAGPRPSTVRPRARAEGLASTPPGIPTREAEDVEDEGGGAPPSGLTLRRMTCYLERAGHVVKIAFDCTPTPLPEPGRTSRTPSRPSRKSGDRDAPLHLLHRIMRRRSLLRPDSPRAATVARASAVLLTGSGPSLRHFPPHGPSLPARSPPLRHLAAAPTRRPCIYTLHDANGAIRAFHTVPSHQFVPRRIFSRAGREPVICLARDGAGAADPRNPQRTPARRLPRRRTEVSSPGAGRSPPFGRWGSIPATFSSSEVSNRAEPSPLDRAFAASRPPNRDASRPCRRQGSAEVATVARLG